MDENNGKSEQITMFSVGVIIIVKAHAAEQLIYEVFQRVIWIIIAPCNLETVAIVVFKDDAIGNLEQYVQLENK